MKINLIPKRKVSQTEAGTIPRSNLDYYVNVVENRLASTTPATDLDAHIADTTTHGVIGAIVGLTDTQELDNKTLDSSVGKGTWTASGTWILPTHTIVSGGSIIGAGTGANGITLKNLKNSAASALSGTQLDITIDIGGTPYYFTIFATKA